MKMLILTILLISTSVLSAPDKPEKSDGYIIDQPGTITFTSGVKIKGKVEKPQVVIFMTKEKTSTRAMEFNYSFKDEIMEPIDFIPLSDASSDTKK